jgi:hypothetical protein
MCYRLVCVLVLGCAVAGCASLSGYPDNPTNADTDLIPLKYYSFDPNTIIYCQKSGSPQCRNEIIYGRVAAYDIEFAKF